MKIRIQLVIERGEKKTTEDISCFEREGLSAESLGLTLKEAKTITSEIQKKMVPHQITDFISASRFCSCCGTNGVLKDTTL